MVQLSQLQLVFTKEVGGCMTNDEERIIMFNRVVALGFVAFFLFVTFHDFYRYQGSENLMVNLAVDGIPPILLAIVVIAGWNHELVGALGFMGVALVHFLGYLIFGDLAHSGILVIIFAFVFWAPEILIGLMYLKSWEIKKNS